jgi:hypothetical protein
MSFGIATNALHASDGLTQNCMEILSSKELNANGKVIHNQILYH